MKLALDATYSLGSDLSGVGVYSRELLWALAQAHRDQNFAWYYRPHRFLRSLGKPLPANARRRLLVEGAGGRGGLFHGLCQRLPKRRFAKQVATFHDLFVMTAEYSTPEFRKRFTEQARRAAGEADRIIAVSAFTGRQVEALLGVEPGRIRVVHHGVKLSNLLPRKPEKIVLHVGAIQKRKNILRLVKAFEAMPAEWMLVLAGAAGYGADEILSSIERSARRGDIVVTGYVDARQLAQWYSRASVFAFPSLDEGFGMPVLEAMQAGVAVVASNRAALPEVCGGAAKLVNPDATDELAAALLELAEDEDKRRHWEELGRKRAELFSWERTAEETWRVYAEILVGGGTSLGRPSPAVY